MDLNGYFRSHIDIQYCSSSYAVDMEDYTGPLVHGPSKHNELKTFNIFEF